MPSIWKASRGMLYWDMVVGYCNNRTDHARCRHLALTSGGSAVHKLVAVAVAVLEFHP